MGELSIHLEIFVHSWWQEEEETLSAGITAFALMRRA
jgi:hypothetical protein